MIWILIVMMMMRVIVSQIYKKRKDGHSCLVGCMQTILSVKIPFSKCVLSINTCPQDESKERRKPNTRMDLGYSFGC